MFSIISTVTVFKTSRHLSRIGIGAVTGLALCTLSCSRAQRTPTGLSALHVPQGFKVESVSGPNLVSYPMMGTIDDRGRLFLANRRATRYPLTR